MFTKHVYHKQRVEVSSHNNTTVTEHRAPTDESVKLLYEMEAKAKDKVLNAYFVELDRNSVSGVVVEWDNDIAYNKVMWSTVFNINGRIIRTEGSSPKDEFSVDRVFMQELAKEVTVQLMAQFEAIKIVSQMKGKK